MLPIHIAQLDQMVELGQEHVDHLLHRVAGFLIGAERQARQHHADGHQQRTHRAPRARTAGERGHDGEEDGRARQRQRAHVEERARPHRRPAQHREHDQADQQGDAGARGRGDRALHAGRAAV